MNTPKPEIVKLDRFNLCGTDGTLDYVEYRPQFSGRFDSAGEPIFESWKVRCHVPIARPHPGCLFQGSWVNHQSQPFVVVDNLLLKLAFECRPPLESLDPITERPQLLIEGVLVADPDHGQRPAWLIHEHDNFEDLRCLTPIIKQTVLPIAQNNDVLQIPRDQALRFLAEEIQLISAARRAIYSGGEPEIPIDIAQAMAQFEVLGDEYRKAAVGEILHVGLLRTIENSLAHAKKSELPELEADYAEIKAGPERRKAVFDRLERVFKHPRIAQAIGKETERIVWSYRGKGRRLKELEHLQTRLVSAHTTSQVRTPCTSQPVKLDAKDPKHSMERKPRMKI